MFDLIQISYGGAAVALLTCFVLREIFIVAFSNHAIEPVNKAAAR